jgi:hypothetical protein
MEYISVSMATQKNGIYLKEEYLDYFKLVYK